MTTDEAAGLKPCPCCTGDFSMVRLKVTITEIYIWCQRCWLRIKRENRINDESGSIARCVEAWNTRNDARAEAAETEVARLTALMGSEVDRNTLKLMSISSDGVGKMNLIERDEWKKRCEAAERECDEARKLLTDIAARTRRETSDERIELERRILGYQARIRGIQTIITGEP